MSSLAVLGLYRVLVHVFFYLSPNANHACITTVA